MTQQYIRGELSISLAQLLSGLDKSLSACILDLRRRVESAPEDELAELAGQAIDVAAAVCWASLARHDVTGFERDCREAASLHEFATCAGLLP